MQPLTRPSVTRRLLRAYPELAAVLAAATIGLIVPAPLRWLSQHQGIDIVLIVLVLATALTITLDDVGHVATSKARIAAALVAGSTVLPALAWAVAHIVQAGPLRNGVLTIGLARTASIHPGTLILTGGELDWAAQATESRPSSRRVRFPLARTTPCWNRAATSKVRSTAMDG